MVRHILSTGSIYVVSRQAYRKQDKEKNDEEYRQSNLFWVTELYSTVLDERLRDNPRKHDNFLDDFLAH